MLRPATSILTIVVCLLLAASAFAGSRTFMGIVTDTMCGKKHMIAGKSDADCTRECMKSKGDWTYGLVVGERVYRLSGNSQELDSFAGKHVRVTGDLKADTIALQSITSDK